jgi:2-methylcitrate dehydratase PrpD
MSSDADPAKLTDRLGARWAVLETSFKFHASCRHTHPAADALLKVLEVNDLAAGDISRIVAHVHQGAIDVLGPVVDPVTVHQAKFSMPATLGLIATHRHAGMAEFDAYLKDDAARAFLDRVEMKLDPEVDAAYPNRWIGKISVTTPSGETLVGRVDEPKGDPSNTLSREEIDAKARKLATYGKGLDEAGIHRLMPRLWSIADSNEISRLL